MDYDALVEVYADLEATEADSALVETIEGVLASAEEETLRLLVTLLRGRPFVAWDDRDLGVSSSLTRQAIAKATGHSEDQIEAWWRETGDLGSAGAKAVESERQQTLFTQSLSVGDVQATLERIATLEGPGSQQRRVEEIAGLLADADPQAAKYLVRTVLENLRIGVGEGAIRDAIAGAFLDGSDEAIEAVQRAYQVTNDFREVAETARAAGREGLTSMKIRVGRPIDVMLAEKAESIEAGIESVAEEREAVLAEYKYDGVRAQIHIDDGQITIFTRRLADVTEQFPDVVRAVESQVNADRAILEAELLAYDPGTGETRPFQTLSKRIERKYDVEEMAAEIPVTAACFDAVYLEESLLDEPLERRLEALNRILEAAPREIERAANRRTGDPAELEAFYEAALDDGQEGIMLKNSAATYQPGSRVGYMVKVKPTLETLDLVVSRATYSEGRRSNQLGRLYLACRGENNQFWEVGRLSTGFTDEQLAEVTAKLKPLITDTQGRDVDLEPALVLEVEFEELQQSPEYDSGYALRFPRFVGFREDLGPGDVDTLQRIESLYDQQ
ncbi:MAG: ATP-dependent DNA ligase [Halodesulfurarchaeum sp.]